MGTIRELRRERSWTQYELALRVGVHPQAVYLWESGRRTPQVPQLRKLGKIFGLCSDEIDLPTIKTSREPVLVPEADEPSPDRPAGRDVQT